jgi:Holliday junction DNA helicase RuvA
MIGRLEGILCHRSDHELTLDVQGVGYEVLIPLSTLHALPAVGSPLVLWTHLAVREDAHTLFGFMDVASRQLFRTLIRVNGVGPKLALAILSAMEPDQFAQAIAQQSVTTLVKIPGVGKKVAERLVLELQGKLGATPGDRALPGVAAGAPDPVSDAVVALVSLGYKPAQAERMVQQVQQADMSSDELIRQALKAAL